MQLTIDQQNELQNTYPDATSFILHCELKNEYEYLKDNEYILNDWQKKRFLELDNLFKGR